MSCNLLDNDELSFVDTTPRLTNIREPLQQRTYVNRRPLLWLLLRRRENSLIANRDTLSFIHTSALFQAKTCCITNTMWLLRKRLWPDQQEGEKEAKRSFSHHIQGGEDDCCSLYIHTHTHTHTHTPKPLV